MVALRRRRDDVVRDLVVGPVGPQVLLHPVVEEVLSATHLAVRAEQVHEVVGPLLDIFFAVEQAVDQLVSFAGVIIRQEGAHFGPGRDAPRQIKRHAAQELDIRRQRRMRHAVARHLAEDVLVDEVPPLHAAGLRARCGPEQPIRQLGRFLRLRTVEQRTMRLGKLLRGENFGASLARLVLFLRGQHRSCQQRAHKYASRLLHERPPRWTKLTIWYARPSRVSMQTHDPSTQSITFLFLSMVSFGVRRRGTNPKGGGNCG